MVTPSIPSRRSHIFNISTCHNIFSGVSFLYALNLRSRCEFQWFKEPDFNVHRILGLIGIPWEWQACILKPAFLSANTCSSSPTSLINTITFTIILIFIMTSQNWLERSSFTFTQSARHTATIIVRPFGHIVDDAKIFVCFSDSHSGGRIILAHAQLQPVVAQTNESLAVIIGSADQVKEITTD